MDMIFFLLRKLRMTPTIKAWGETGNMPQIIISTPTPQPTGPGKVKKYSNHEFLAMLNDILALTNKYIINFSIMYPSGKITPLGRGEAHLSSKRQASRVLENSPLKDRVFPAEAADLDEYEQANDRYAKDAVIHTGPYADELTRIYNIMALTYGHDNGTTDG
jgi:hypothetical protein